MKLLKDKFSVLFVLLVFSLICVFAAAIFFKDPRWVHELKSEARKGDAKAQYELAEFYNSRGDQGLNSDYDNSFKWYEKSASQGYMPAKLELAMLYYYGQGVDPDKVKAFELLLEGARKGDRDFQFQLAELYSFRALDNGFLDANESKDSKWYKEANKWYEEAANQGHIGAHFALARAYSLGFGVEEDLQQTVNWYIKATDLGSIKAVNDLGLLFAEDLRVIDYEMAFKWFQVGAEQGYPESQFNLGLMYKEGLGVGQYYSLARIWFDKACDNGMDKACEEVEELKILGY